MVLEGRSVVTVVVDAEGVVHVRREEESVTAEGTVNVRLLSSLGVRVGAVQSREGLGVRMILPPPDDDDDEGVATVREGDVESGALTDTDDEGVADALEGVNERLDENRERLVADDDGLLDGIGAAARERVLPPRDRDPPRERPKSP